MKWIALVLLILVACAQPVKMEKEAEKVPVQEIKVAEPTQAPVSSAAPV